MRYGATIVGASDAAIARVRRSTCAATGSMHGRSALARLQLAKFDVGAAMAVDTICEWAKACRDQFVTPQSMFLAWRHSFPLVAVARWKFAVLKGPTSAMIASAFRPGWKVPAPDVFIDQPGATISLRTTCPAQVRLHALAALSAMEAARSSWTSVLGGSPAFEPLL